MKKQIGIVFLVFTVLFLGACQSSNNADTPKEPDVVELPNPIDTSKKYKPSQDAAEEACKEGVYAAGCSSISVDNLDEYLGLDDVLYIDLRDYSDYSQKHFRNFEVVPFFAYVYNKEAHTNAELIQLYGGDLTNPTSVYKESDKLLNVLFPKDKVIFLMCQSGGRVAQLMKILESRGWDMSKIYNVGGVGQYTASKYTNYITDSLEFGVEATYKFEGLTRVAK